MIDRIKYVIVDECKPILFNCFNHSDTRSLPGKPTSAGFVSFEIVKNDGIEFPSICSSTIIKAHTYGESISLKMKPSPRDAYLITKMLNPC